MAKRANSGRGLKVGESYFNLIHDFPLVSIRSESQLNAAQAKIDGLLSKRSLDKGESQYLDALSDLVATYEDAHYAIAPASDAEILRHLMEAKGVTQTELHREARIPKSTISEVLAGKKAFSKTLIRQFAQFFEVDATVLAANLVQSKR